MSTTFNALGHPLLWLKVPAKVGPGAAQVQDGAGGGQQRHHRDPRAQVARDGRAACEHGNREGEPAPQETGKGCKMTTQNDHTIMSMIID